MKNNQIFSKNELTIGTYYILQLKNKLGRGSFGEIYKGKNTKLNIDIAIKCEQIKSNHHQRLKYEAGVLKYLNGGGYQKPLGIPILYDFISIDNCNYMMMELLGPSLEDLFDLCQRHFSLKTILSLGDQMLCRIEFLHSRYLVHRDIKPDNFLMGLYNNKSIVYICDFGLCKKYRDQNTKHIPFKDGKSLTGTARYASIYSHLGYEQSRRDDLESLAYSLIYFSRGSLPWMGIKAQNKTEKYKKIFKTKMDTTINFLCEKLPNEFIDFFHYIRELQFEDKPNYLYLKSLLGKMYDKNKFNYDMIFDFTSILIKNEEKEKEQNNQTNLNTFFFLENKERKNQEEKKEQKEIKKENTNDTKKEKEKDVDENKKENEKNEINHENNNNIIQNESIINEEKADIQKPKEDSERKKSKSY